MHSEICYMTGSPAFAHFHKGFAKAWYGSDLDGGSFVDISGTLDGPVSDDILRKAIENGKVVQFAMESDGLAWPSEIGEAAAIMLFKAGAEEQKAASANPDPEPSVPEVSLPSHSRFLLNPIPLPRPFASISWLINRLNDVHAQRGSPIDFHVLGRLWQLNGGNEAEIEAVAKGTFVYGQAYEAEVGEVYVQVSPAL